MEAKDGLEERFVLREVRARLPIFITVSVCDDFGSIWARGLKSNVEGKEE